MFVLSRYSVSVCACGVRRGVRMWCVHVVCAVVCAFVRIKTSKYIKMYILYHMLFVVIEYSLYVQYSSSMGNIWLRPNAENEMVFCPMNLVGLILSPFHREYFWSVSLLPVNICMHMLVYFAVLYIVTHFP
jgi:hypothetical protein